MEHNRVIELIKEIRKTKGWTQLYMAEQLGITQSSYGKIERGDVDITISKVFKILKTINQDPADFFQMLSNGGVGAISIDPELSYQLEDLKSKMERQEAEIKYLRRQIEIKDEKIVDLQQDVDALNSLTDELTDED